MPVLHELHKLCGSLVTPHMMWYRALGALNANFSLYLMSLGSLHSQWRKIGSLGGDSENLNLFSAPDQPLELPASPH